MNKFRNYDNWLVMVTCALEDEKDFPGYAKSEDVDFAVAVIDAAALYISSD